MQRFYRLSALLFLLCASLPVAHAKDDGHDKDRATWVKNGGVWQMKQTHELVSRSTTNGKPVK